MFTECEDEIAVKAQQRHELLIRQDHEIDAGINLILTLHKLPPSRSSLHVIIVRLYLLDDADER